MPAIKNFYQRNPKLIARKIGNEFIVIDPDRETFTVLNQTGESIYKFLDRKRALNEIAEKISNEFVVDKRKAFSDIKAFLISTLEKGLVKKV